MPRAPAVAFVALVTMASPAQSKGAAGDAIDSYLYGWFLTTEAIHPYTHEVYDHVLEWNRTWIGCVIGKDLLNWSRPYRFACRYSRWPRRGL
jgi:hypothetical protein